MVRCCWTKPRCTVMKMLFCAPTNKVLLLLFLGLGLALAHTTFSEHEEDDRLYDREEDHAHALQRSRTHSHSHSHGRALQSCVFPASELQALRDIYDSTDGEHWAWSGEPWNFSQPQPDPCAQQWQGVTCDAQCSVSLLYLTPTQTADSSSPVSLNLRGSLPASIGLLKSLFSLSVNGNPGLKGTIPASLGSLSLLYILELRSNALSGTIPAEIANLSALGYLTLEHNFLHGNLSHVPWTSMGALTSLTLTGNVLTGTVPPSLFQLPKLATLKAEGNNLTGTLPSEGIAALSLRTIDFSLNNLTGTLPSFSGLKRIKTLRLFRNRFTGSIPSEWTLIQSLNDLEIDNNMLTGTIPPEFIDLPNLAIFYAFNNHLTGHLPAFSSRHQCTHLNVFNNYLTGAIPADLSLNFRMLSLDIHANFFEGEFPRGIASSQYMSMLYMHNNQLTGPLPSLENMHSLWQARFDWNLFTGPIPQGLGGFEKIGSFNLSYNYLTGTIASNAFPNLTTLEILDLSSNFFRGTLGSSLSYLPRLQRLLLQDNFLSGDLHSLFDFSTQRNLSTLDISANELSGSIPDAFFTSSNLSTFVASTNCFTGSLSDAMCANEHIQILVLDGLHTAEFCKELIFPHIPRFDKTYMLNKPLLGSIPACLFNISSLRTLHLAGNAIHGSLPSDLRVGEELKYLSLSHNQLTGTIPAQLLRHPFLGLDLSFNKLTGTIDSENVHNFSLSGETVTFGTTSSSAYSLALNINRLSGKLPSVWRDVERISVLQGNMFECPEGKDSLPQRDDRLTTYECGSNVVDSSLYTWVSGMVFLFLLFLAMYFTVISPRFRAWNRFNRWLFSLWRYLEVEVYGWWGVFSGRSSALFYAQSIESIYEFGVVMREIRRWIFALSVLIVFVFLPLFLVLSAFFGTYAREYAWSLALAYMSGETPAIVVLVFMLLLLFGVFSGLCKGLWINIFHLYQRCVKKTTNVRGNKDTHKTIGTDDDINGVGQSSPSTGETAVSASTGKDELSQQQDGNANPLAPVLAIPMQTLSSAREVEFTRSFARCYTAMALGGLLNVIIVLSVNMSYVSSSFSAETQQFVSFLVCVYKIVWNSVVMEIFQFVLTKLRPLNKNDRSHGEVAVVSFMLWMSLFNNIIAPCIAVAFVSGDCFYYAFSAAPTVSTSFAFEQCDAFFTSFSSSTTGQLFCQDYYTTGYISEYDPPFTYNYQCTSSLLTKFVDVIIYRFILTGFVIPAIHIWVKWMQERVFIRHGTEGMLFSITTASLPETLCAISNTALEERQRVKQAEDVEKDKADVLPRASFKVKNFVVSLISDIAVLLTFGTIFPPVAIIGCSALFAHTAFTQLMLGRVVVLSRTQPWLVSAVQKINVKCAGIRYLLVKSLLSLALLSSVFWSLFLFDIFGDAAGWERSLWLIALMTAVPGTIMCANALLQWLDPLSAPSIDDWREDGRTEGEGEGEKAIEDDIELAAIAPAAVSSAQYLEDQHQPNSQDFGAPREETRKDIEEVHSALHNSENLD